MPARASREPWELPGAPTGGCAETSAGARSTGRGRSEKRRPAGNAAPRKRPKWSCHVARRAPWAGGEFLSPGPCAARRRWRMPPLPSESPSSPRWLRGAESPRSSGSDRCSPPADGTRRSGAKPAPRVRFPGPRHRPTPSRRDTSGARAAPGSGSAAEQRNHPRPQRQRSRRNALPDPWGMLRWSQSSESRENRT